MTYAPTKHANADAVALVNEATDPANAGRVVATYTDAERTVAVTVATLIGIREASRRLDVPDRTLRTWCADFGGLAALRAAAGDAVRTHGYAVVVLACEELVKRMGDASLEQLLDVVRLLGVTGAAPRGTDDADDVPATAPVLVQFNVGDGKPPDVIAVAPNAPHVAGAPSAPSDAASVDVSATDADAASAEGAQS